MHCSFTLFPSCSSSLSLSPHLLFPFQLFPSSFSLCAFPPCAFPAHTFPLRCFPLKMARCHFALSYPAPLRCSQPDEGSPWNWKELCKPLEWERAGCARNRTIPDTAHSMAVTPTSSMITGGWDIVHPSYLVSHEGKEQIVGEATLRAGAMASPVPMHSKALVVK